MAQKKQDTFSYRGWLVSDSFLKRSFAVLGYYHIAALIIAAPIIFIVVVLAIIFGLALS